MNARSQSMRRAVLVLAALPLAVACRGSSAPGRATHGYWNASCVSGDGRSLLAGGDHAALLDLADGRTLERVPSMVKALGCETSGGIVVGYSTAVRLPGKTPVTPAPDPGGDAVLALAPGGAWISQTRRSSGGRWQGPARLFVAQDGATRSLDLLPVRFGAIGTARPLPTPDTFAVRFGNLLDDGRLLLAAGWQPSRAGNAVEDVPWAFFALDLPTGEAEPLTPPLQSDAALNQGWLQRIAATRDGARLAVAAHDGARLSLAQFERGSGKASLVTVVAAAGSPSALAFSADGVLVAVGTETRGADAPGRVWVIDREGRTVWSGDFPKTVVGLHFLADGALVIAGADARAAKLALPAGTRSWPAD